MPASPAVIVDQPAAQVARIRINRPERRNAIDHAVRTALYEAFVAVLADPDLRAVILGGVGGHFSAGGDLPSMVGLDETAARERMQHGHRLCGLVASSDIPVVSAIEGVGAGAGIGLALLGDCIVVGERSRIAFPFLELGLTPDWGTMFSLPRRVGPALARRILFESRLVHGPEAFRIGLADVLVADEEVAGAAVAQAVRLAALPSGAFARTKRRLADPSARLADELVREESDQVACLCGEEFAEGHAARKERRAPDFRGPRRPVMQRERR